MFFSTFDTVFENIPLPHPLLALPLLALDQKRTFVFELKKIKP